MANCQCHTCVRTVRPCTYEVCLEDTGSDVLSPLQHRWARSPRSVGSQDRFVSSAAVCDHPLALGDHALGRSAGLQLRQVFRLCACPTGILCCAALGRSPRAGTYTRHRAALPAQMHRPLRAASVSLGTRVPRTSNAVRFAGSLRCCLPHKHAEVPHDPHGLAHRTAGHSSRASHP